MELNSFIAAIGMAVLIFSAIFAWFQAQAAKKSLRQSYLLKLFSTFDVASQYSIANQELLYSVHGLDRKRLARVKF